MEAPPDASAPPVEKKSTLIEFPGVTRNSVPEWRKELSERVRVAQEKRARDAAREAAEAERQRLEAATRVVAAGADAGHESTGRCRAQTN